jgi:hypothetical protein
MGNFFAIVSFGYEISFFRGALGGHLWRLGRGQKEKIPKLITARFNAQENFRKDVALAFALKFVDSDTWGGVDA